MNRATARLLFKTPYCQSRFHGTPKLNKELSDDYERRTWKERLHVEEGEIVIPGLAFANCIKETAKFLGVQIPGKGRSTFTKHFEAGLMVLDNVRTGKKPEDAVEKRMFVPSDGRRGGGSRVMKSYPILLPPLAVSVDFYITDDIINPETFAYHLQQAGTLIGLGSFRVRNNGVFGRFVVEEIDWQENREQNSLPPINIIK